jgi:hypothetical protein
MFLEDDAAGAPCACDYDFPQARYGIFGRLGDAGAFAQCEPTRLWNDPVAARLDVFDRLINLGRREYSEGGGGDV